MTANARVPKTDDLPLSHETPGSLEVDSSALLELLTVDEVAKLLKVSKSWVYEHTRNRATPRSEQLPHIKLGKYVRFDPSAIRAFLGRKARLR
jgi:excisionase family DNA binding protein